MWEDERNKRGGRWLITLNKQQRRFDLDRFWLETVGSIQTVQNGPAEYKHFRKHLAVHVHLTVSAPQTAESQWCCDCLAVIPLKIWVTTPTRRFSWSQWIAWWPARDVRRVQTMTHEPRPLCPFISRLMTSCFAAPVFGRRGLRRLQRRRVRSRGQRPCKRR